MESSTSWQAVNALYLGNKRGTQETRRALFNCHSWVQLCQARLCCLPWPRHGCVCTRRGTAAQTHSLLAPALSMWREAERQPAQSRSCNSIKGPGAHCKPPDTARAVCHQSPRGIDSEGNCCKSFQHEAKIVRPTGAEFLGRRKAGSIDPKFNGKPRRHGISCSKR